VPDRRPVRTAQRRVVSHGTRGALTAAVRPLETYDSQALTINPTEQQREAWTYFKAIGECYYGVAVWLANAVSRCRLVLAERVPGSDEPTPITEGPLAQEVSRIGGGSAGQATMLKRMTVQVSVAGESFLVTTEDPLTGGRKQTAYSNTELRIVGRNPLRYQVWEQRAEWIQLPNETLVSRVWWPDDELMWLASSPVMAALPILREIDMYNRYIMAILLSRVASNGLLMIPNEVEFPTKPGYQDATDPFIAELLDAASKTIQNPGSASAAIPFTVRMPGAWIEKVRHLPFATELGQKVMDDRDKSIHRLATVLNMPIEAMEGMGDTSHWNAWQISEDAVKIHVAPVVEVICNGLTESFLRPIATAAGELLRGPNGGELIIWYDASALYQQPDRSAEAKELFDRAAISNEALLRESGFDAEDAPSDDEIKDQVLTSIAMKGGADALAALSILVNDPSIALVPTRVTVADPGQTPDAEPPGGSTPVEPQSPPSGDRTAPPAPAQTPPPPGPGGTGAPTRPAAPAR
jgi:hypothetical protein